MRISLNQSHYVEIVLKKYIYRLQTYLHTIWSKCKNYGRELMKVYDDQNIKVLLAAFFMSLIVLDSTLSMLWDYCVDLTIIIVWNIDILLRESCDTLKEPWILNLTIRDFLLYLKDTSMYIGIHYHMIPKQLVAIYLV
jgi:hypothetical protein